MRGYPYAPQLTREQFGYSARGLTAYTNQLGFVTWYAYDEAGRKTYETNANTEIIRYTNNAASDLLSLTDGKNQTTRWNYDTYGRVTNKLDQAGSVILKYAYDADNRLTNRWSAAKGNTGYAYDWVGNLTNIAYPASGTVRLAYDWLNRLTNMVDSAGTTKYSYTAGNQLLSEGGVFASDMVTNTYMNRRRVGLRLQQPSGVWTNGFGWDAAGRLTNVLSPAGSFVYTYRALSGGFAGRLVQELGLPNGAYITNFYDAVARLGGATLKSSGGTTLDAALYGYNVGNQRTAYTNATGTNVLCTYDYIGQLKTGLSSASSENRGYAYDGAWNLNWRTNNGSTVAFWVNGLNELTNLTGYSLSYDANGNLLTNPATQLSYTYDDENRLVGVVSYVHLSFSTGFIYDGLGRLRERDEYLLGQWLRALVCDPGGAVYLRRLAGDPGAGHVQQSAG